MRKSFVPPLDKQTWRDYISNPGREHSVLVWCRQAYEDVRKLPDSKRTVEEKVFLEVYEEMLV